MKVIYLKKYIFKVTPSVRDTKLDTFSQVLRDAMRQIGKNLRNFRIITSIIPWIVDGISWKTFDFNSHIGKNHMEQYRETWHAKGRLIV